MRFVDYVMCKYSSPPTKEAAKVNESSSEIGETGWHDPSQVLINFWFRLFIFFGIFLVSHGQIQLCSRPYRNLEIEMKMERPMSMLGKHIL